MCRQAEILIMILPSFIIAHLFMYRLSFFLMLPPRTSKANTVNCLQDIDSNNLHKVTESF